MPRFLAAACWLALWLPLVSHAIGLGEIELDSALNQPFDASIPITGAAPGEAAELRVRLASRETFERYGLDRPRFLTELNFDVRTSGAGGPSIRVTSRQAIVEPFVTILVEVDWSQGRLLREFTVLLDPPVFREQSEPVPVEPPLSQAGTSPRSGTIDRPVTSQPRREEVTAGSGRTGRSAGSFAAGEEYGPVSRNETLWSIAQRTRASSSVAINQMMVAIYEANPDAFNGNINSLRAGAILRLPSQDQIGAVNRGSANAEVRRQHEAWATRTGGTGGRLRLVPPEDASEQAVAAGSPASGQTAGTSETVRPDDTSQTRIAALEAELSSSRQLLQVRDEEMRALQQRLAALEAARADAGAPDESRGAAVADADELPGDAAGDDAADAAVGDAALAADTTADETLVADSEPADSEPVDSQATDSAMPPARTDVVVSSPAPTSWLDGLIRLATNIWLWVAALVVVLGTLFVARFRRQEVVDETGRWEALSDVDEVRVAEEEREATESMRTHAREDEDSIVVEEQEADIDAAMAALGEQTATETPLAGLLDEEPESPLESTLSSETALNLDQADPIAEAEFHMAYGLYDQAADLLTSALAADPDQLDLRLKLLEVYFVWENKEGFLAQATELREQSADLGDAAWGKVVIMGRQLCPDEALFTGRTDSVGGGDIDLAFDSDDSPGIDVALDSDSGDSGVFDIDLNDLDSESADVDLDFDATGLADEAATVDQPGPESPTIESPTIESVAADPTIESPTTEAPLADEGTSQLPSLDDGLADVLGEAGTSDDQTAEIDLDDLGLDLTGLDAAVEQVTADIGETGEIPAPDLEGIPAADDDAGSDFIGGETTVSGGKEHQETIEEPLSDDDATRLADVDERVAGEERAGEPADDSAVDDDAWDDEEAPEVSREQGDAADELAHETVAGVFDDLAESGLSDDGELADDQTEESIEPVFDEELEPAISDEDATLLADANEVVAGLEADDDATAELAAFDEQGGLAEGLSDDDATLLADVDALVGDEDVGDEDAGDAEVDVEPTAEFDILPAEVAEDEIADADDYEDLVDSGGDELSDEDLTMLAGSPDDILVSDSGDAELDDPGSTAELPAFGDADASGLLADSDETAELAGLTSEDPVLDFGFDGAGDDTVEQPELGDTAEQPAPGAEPEDVFSLLDSDDASEPPGGEVDESVDEVLEPFNPVQAEQTMTEVGTKLDLARAYVDMGDPEGARSILNEVLEEGDDEQRQEAASLLDGLPG